MSEKQKRRIKQPRIRGYSFTIFGVLRGKSGLVSIRINFEKASKDFNKQVKKMVKRFDVEREANIHKTEAEFQRKLFARFLRDNWTEYIIKQKW